MAALRIGSRGSQLALWQANHIASLLKANGHHVEIEIIRTTGDKIADIALSQVGTKGMFTKEIEEALAEGRVHLAVHSLKDLPTEVTPGFELAAITRREDPRDVLLSRDHRGLNQLPQGARVGTSSLRRQAQLRALRPDLEIHPLGRTELVREFIPAEIMCPAAGQGALGIEVREGDGETRQHLLFLDDAAARSATTCERALLHRLGGGCQVPIGALAEVRGEHLHLTAVVAHPDGSQVLREAQSDTNSENLAASVAKALLARGAEAILQELYGNPVAAPQQP